ncbi:MAG: C45 family autoproteolytic acyltransferase/hydrolase [Planctomycetia bacterium]|nr:C45 family autoproteolytic acyltransferase/hydrolase [Planctomycetia bacterium]
METPQEFRLPICEVTEVSGSGFEMGFARGQRHRWQLTRALRRYADIAFSAGQTLLAKRREYSDCELENCFGAEITDELHGLAAGSGLSLTDLVRHNLSVFPIHATGLSGCVQFAGCASDGTFVHGANLDVTFTRIVPDALEPALIVRRPTGKIPSLSLVPTGLVGSRGGLNAAGVLVSTCDLLDDAFADSPDVGLRRGALMSLILDNADSYESACSMAKELAATGAKAIALTDMATGRVTLSENYGRTVVQRAMPTLIQANHSLLLAQELGGSQTGGLEEERGIPAHSRHRYRRLKELLVIDDSGRFTWDSGTISSVLRDDYDPETTAGRSTCVSNLFRTMNMILRLDNVWSWLYRACDNTFLVCPTGTPWRSETRRSVWSTLSLTEILPEWQPAVKAFGEERSHA